MIYVVFMTDLCLFLAVLLLLPHSEAPPKAVHQLMLNISISEDYRVGERTLKKMNDPELCRIKQEDTEEPIGWCLLLKG